MNFLCTSCRKKLAVPEAALGKKIRCPSCQTVFAATDANRAEAIVPPRAKSPVAAAPPPLTDYEELEPAAPRKKKPRRLDQEAEPFTPIEFRAIVKNKTDALKKGNYKATLDEEGMVIKLNRKQELDVPRGTPVEHENKNIINVEIEGDQVRMALMRTRTYNNRFAQAVADFMNRDLPAVHIQDYVIPWAMFILVILPWGVPIITLGGLAPILIGAGISGANFAIISKEEWSPGLRVTLASILTGVAFLMAIVLLALVVMAAARHGFPG